MASAYSQSLVRVWLLCFALLGFFHTCFLRPALGFPACNEWSGSSDKMDFVFTPRGVGSCFLPLLFLLLLLSSFMFIFFSFPFFFACNRGLLSFSSCICFPAALADRLCLQGLTQIYAVISICNESHALDFSMYNVKLVVGSSLLIVSSFGIKHRQSMPLKVNNNDLELLICRYG